MVTEFFKLLRITDYQQSWFGPMLYIHFQTNLPVHFFIRLSGQAPGTRPTFIGKRGLQVYCPPTFPFPGIQGIEQLEPGDTLSHTFNWYGWRPCITRYWIFVDSGWPGRFTWIPPTFKAHMPDQESAVPVLLDSDQIADDDFPGWFQNTSGSGQVSRTKRDLRIFGTSGLAVGYRYFDQVASRDADFDKDVVVMWYGGVETLPGAGNYFNLLHGGTSPVMNGLDNKGFGFNIQDDGSVRGMVHNGTVLSYIDLAFTVTPGQAHRFELWFTAGQDIIWRIDGTQRGSSQAIPSGAQAGGASVRVVGGHILLSLGQFDLNRLFYSREW